MDDMKKYPDQPEQPEMDLPLLAPEAYNDILPLEEEFSDEVTEERLFDDTDLPVEDSFGDLEAITQLEMPLIDEEISPIEEPEILIHAQSMDSEPVLDAFDVAESTEYAESEAALEEAEDAEVSDEPEAEPVMEPTPAPEVRSVRKGRPKRKKGVGLLGIPHLLATVIWLLIIAAIGTSLGRMIWVCAADALAFGRESKKVTVTIPKDATNEEIAETLYEAGLIRYPGVFELYADLAVDEGEIVPGTYELDTIYDYMALVVQISNRSSSRETTEVLIPEGLNCRQIFDLLEEKKVCTVEELEEYAANGELDDFWFLEGVERGDKYCLEGYLFPDTYEFYVGGSARHTLEKMLSGFDYRIKEEHTAMLPALNERLSAMMRKNGCSEEYIAAHQMDLRDVIIVASLIEEETASVKESPNIASVIYNRLTQDQEYERYLGIDAAIIYALGEHTDTLTAEDLAIDSPYNTRLYAGLTPGPISNPGLESILSALNPEDTKYYYYVLNPESGLHDFSKTLEEHEKKKEKYAEYQSEETE